MANVLFAAPIDQVLAGFGLTGVTGGEPAGHDGTVRVWDLATGAPLHTLTGHRGRVSAVGVSADGLRAVSGGDGTVRVWDLAEGVELASLCPTAASLRFGHTLRSTLVCWGLGWPSLRVSA